MGNYSKITKEQLFITLKNKLESVSSSGLTSVGTNNKILLNKMKTSSSKGLGELTCSGIWEGITSTTVGEHTSKGLNTLISNIEIPVDVVMLTIGNHVDELKRILAYYDKSVDDYNSTVDKYNNLSAPRKSAFKYKGTFDEAGYNNAVRSYNSARASYEATLNSLQGTIQMAIDHINSVQNMIKALMSPSGMYTGVEGYTPFDYKDYEIFGGIQDEYGVQDYGRRELTKEELEVFRETHHIREGDDITVYETYPLVNGVRVPTYYVYTSLYDNEEDFDEFCRDCMGQLSKMDPDILEYLINNDTDLVLLEDPYISTYGTDAYCGIYWPDTRTVQIRYTDWDKDDPKRGDGVIHEFGHAIDAQITGEGNWWLSYIDDPSVMPEEVKSILTDKNGNIVYWKSLIEEECAAMFPCETPERTLENVQNTLDNPTEYIAELVKRYYLSEESRERMKIVAPKSYEALERIFNNIKENS